MPTYVYRCTNNECPNATAFEVQHPMAESWDGDECQDHCYGTLKKVFTPTPAIFRGQGWAKMTEYKAKKS